MQFRAAVCSVLVAGANAVTAQAEVSARVWMLDHPVSDADDMNDLRKENPDAYALVKALLTKRSLGLLDPRHPTASFVPKAPEDPNEDHGAGMYAKFATTEKEKNALAGVTETSSASDPYPDAPAQAAVPYPEAGGAKKDWMSWKPKDQGADDDAMVKNVLGAVAGLTKGKNNLRGAPADDENANPFAAETANQMEAESTTQQVATTTAEVPQASNENPYLKVMEPTEPTVAAVKVAAEPLAAGNALASFAWDDSQTTTTTAAPKAVKGGGGGNPLASWLGLVKPHVTAAAAPPAEKASNPYMMDLQ